MQRYFTNQINQKQAIIEPNDHHHIKNVMRFKVGDEVSICDHEGHCYEGTFQEIDEDIIVGLSEILPTTELPIKVTIAQALIRRERFEYMLQKATELGMQRLIPINTKYSIVDVDKKKEQKKIERWQKIVQEASEQSRRHHIPRIDPITDLKSIDFSAYDAVFVAYEQSNNENTLHNVLRTNQFKNILVVIGPEGGFHPSEIAYLQKHNHTIIVGLGKRILRSETASSYFLSVISYEYELGDNL